MKFLGEEKLMKILQNNQMMEIGNEEGKICKTQWKS